MGVNLNKLVDEQILEIKELRPIYKEYYLKAKPFIIFEIFTAFMKFCDINRVILFGKEISQEFLSCRTLTIYEPSRKKVSFIYSYFMFINEKCDYLKDGAFSFVKYLPIETLRIINLEFDSISGAIWSMVNENKGIKRLTVSSLQNVDINSSFGDN